MSEVERNPSGTPALASIDVAVARSPLRGALRVPGSKSLSNRQIMLAALAGGTTQVHHVLAARDCDLLLDAVAALGADVSRDGAWTHITGVGGHFPRGGSVDLGDGGTPARFMLAAAACSAQPVRVDGSARLRERPMAEGIEMLRSLGARVTCAGAEGHLPAEVTAPQHGLRGGRLEIGATRSSQFASALMLVAPFTDEGIELLFTPPVTSAAYLRLSASALRSFGCAAEEALDAARPRIFVPGRAVQGDRVTARADHAPRVIEIEADASSAVYWMVAAALIPGSSITFPGLPASSLQPDMGILRVLAAAGATVECSAPGAGDGTDAEGGWVRVSFGSAPRGFTADASDWPDGALAAAALAACAEGPSRITGLHTLVHKESDRLAALRTELAALGVRAEITEDSITIDPSGMHRRDAVIHTWNDHRIAMTFAVIALARGGVRVLDPGCVNKSYPNFWADLAQLCGGDASSASVVHMAAEGEGREP